MNAFVTYETDDDNTTAIHRVYVGEGNVRALMKEFYKEVTERFGPPPTLRYVTRQTQTIEVSNNSRTVTEVQEVDPESEQTLNNYRATVHQAKSPHRFGDWLVANKGWTECDDVQQESL